jgi:hypothetical protein
MFTCFSQTKKGQKKRRSAKTNDNVHILSIELSDGRRFRLKGLCVDRACRSIEVNVAIALVQQKNDQSRHRQQKQQVPSKNKPKRKNSPVKKNSKRPIPTAFTKQDTTTAAVTFAENAKQGDGGGSSSLSAVPVSAPVPAPVPVAAPVSSITLKSQLRNQQRKALLAKRSLQASIRESKTKKSLTSTKPATAKESAETPMTRAARVRRLSMKGNNLFNMLSIVYLIGWPHLTFLYLLWCYVCVCCVPCCVCVCGL